MYGSIDQSNTKQAYKQIQSKYTSSWTDPVSPLHISGQKMLPGVGSVLLCSHGHALRHHFGISVRLFHKLLVEGFVPVLAWARLSVLSCCVQNLILLNMQTNYTIRRAWCAP